MAKAKGAGAGRAAPTQALASQGVPLLGEVIAWVLPAGGKWTLGEVRGALADAGIDPAEAKELATRWAFARAVRALAADGLAELLGEDAAAVRFQLTGRCNLGARIDYSYEATVSLDKASGAVSSDDAAAQQAAEQLLQVKVAERTVSDVSRLLLQYLSKQADVFLVKGGVYFVPAAHSALVVALAAFLARLTGDAGCLRRLPVPDHCPAAAATVQTVVRDGLWDRLDDALAAVKDVDPANLREADLLRAVGLVDDALFAAGQYETYLAGSKAILEDHAAYVREQLRRAGEAREAAARAAAGSALVVTA